MPGIVPGDACAFTRHLVSGLIYLLLMLMLAPVFAQSQEVQTLESLQQDGKLSLKVWTEPAENIVARQQVDLYIEVATDKWFTGGTRIGRFEVADTVVLQREKFAVNSTRRVKGETWSVQLWTLTLYPQRGGAFEIPPIPVTLSLAGDDPLVSTEGALRTQPLSFTAAVPPALQALSGWVASPKFSVTEQFNRPLESFKPGDALIRTIRMAADDLPAMMLPEVKPASVPGMALYRKLPQLTDKVNRGDYLAERTEVLTYVFESAGDYVLPAEVFYWWDTGASKLREITLAEHRLQVAGNVPVSVDDNAVTDSPFMSRRSLLLGLGVAALLILFVLLMRNVVKHRKAKQRVVHTEISETRLRRAFMKACRKRQGARAISLLYRYLDHYGGPEFEGSVRTQLARGSEQQLLDKFNQIMLQIYDDETPEELDMRSFARQYLAQIRATDKPALRDRWAVELRLN